MILVVAMVVSLPSNEKGAVIVDCPFKTYLL